MRHTNNLLILAIAASLLVLAGCGANSEDYGKPVSKEEFERSLASSQRITIIQDLRGAPSVGKVAVMQCGVDLAGSEGLAGRQIETYAFEADKCIGRNSTNLGIGDCLSRAKGSASLHVKYGRENASFFESGLVVFVNENTTAMCTVGVAR